MVFFTFILTLQLLSSQDYISMRTEMVEEQIIKRGITHSATIDALKTVPRHLFVPSDLQIYAYHDRPLPIGHNQTISQPYIVAYMTEMLNLKSSDKVLEIGTGSGYQAAVLSKIVKEVYTIEIVPQLGKQAETTFKNNNYTNIGCRIGDGYHGWEEHHPFDAIIITAAPLQVPEKLLNQLKEGGQLIAPIEKNGQQYLTLYTKTKNKIKTKQLIAVRFVPFTRHKD
ncbi:protein-L-isoaspartate(D-aspartate) O-methyltransferase [Carboxylicivirga sp. N1Y132]|uniref:Protein-L-isoaspartate O-methyltransferase n=2 Tax=Carboxylicivirga marina TaxID=2800988 RepID=A0ABS1HGT0_9BACT|nr:protein-L-isoaspartate(D-aspartate) O-methyltransferase [Carboxylicivirga marina]